MLSVILAVSEEGAELVGAQLVRHEYQQFVVVLEVLGELEEELADAVEVLDEDGGPLLLVIVSIIMATPEVELMAEREPVFLYQNRQPFDGPVVGIDQLLG